jgi:hypothetical protein
MVATSLIKENMEVLGSDGIHVGFVEYLMGANVVRLTAENDPEPGEPHEIPLSWVKHVEMKIHLNQPADQAKARWKSVGWTRH